MSERSNLVKRLATLVPVPVKCEHHISQPTRNALRKVEREDKDSNEESEVKKPEDHVN